MSIPFLCLYMKFVYYIFVILIFASCSYEHRQRIESFPVKRKLYAEKMWVDDVFFPGWIMLKKQSLLVVDIKSDTMLYQYSLPDFRRLYKGGVRGQSGDEFQVAPRFCRTMSDKVYIWGYTPFSIKAFTIDDDNHLINEIEYKLPVSEDVANERHIVRDSLLIYNAAPGELAIKKINLNSHKQGGQILFEPDNHHEPFFYENRGYMAANDSLIIYAYIYKKQIDFYNVDNLKLRKRLVGDGVVPQIVVGDLDNSISYHQGLVACKKYFYVKCRGKENDVNLQVFDYSGHSIAEYTFDIPPHYFDVDEQNRIIYGYNNEFEDYFLKYSF